MTLKKLLAGFLVALGLQAAAFAWYNDDLLYFRRSVDEILRDDASVFTRHAERAIARTRLTRRHLDTIADAARHHERADLEVRALERRAAIDPDDEAVQVRLADAYRRAGQLDKAEQLYLRLLDTSRTPQP